MFSPKFASCIRHLEIKYFPTDFYYTFRNASFLISDWYAIGKGSYCSKHKISAYNFCGKSLIFHRIWTCSRSLLTYIMRWRVLFTKIPGPLLHEINSSHKTSLEALHEGGSHELEWITWVEWLGGKGGGAIGMVVVSGKKEKVRQTQRNAHTEKLT